MKETILISLLVVVVPLVFYSLSVAQRVRTDREFFLGITPLSARELFSSLAASWLMLGNVFLACLFLGALYGWHNLWIVITWLLAFLLMKRHLGAVTEALGKHSTLHSFLGAKYASPQLRRVAAVATATTGLGIIALEIIVVMALLVPAGGGASPIMPLVGGLVILFTLAAYSVLGGFSAVTGTDKYQLFAVIMSLIAVLILLVGITVGGIVPLQGIREVVDSRLSDTGTSVAWFYLGLFFLQIPLFLGDFGTWQRIKACKGPSSTEVGVWGPSDQSVGKSKVSSSVPISVEEEEVTFGRLGWVNAFMWIILIGAGAVIAAIPEGTVPTYPGSFLYDTARPIVDLLNLTAVLGQAWGGYGVYMGYFMVFLITIGLISAMMSTADSYLLITMQSIFDDILGRPSDGTDAMRFARIGSLLAVVVAFSIAAYVLFSKANFLPIVSLLFSIQVTLAPLTVWALYGQKIDEYAGRALFATVTGVVACLGYGIWGAFSLSAGEFHKANVTFILPVMAFAIPFLLLSQAIVRSEGWTEWWRWCLSFLGRRADRKPAS